MLANNIYLMDVEAPRVAKHCEPGQFVIVKIDEKGERVPLTICDYDREAGTVTIQVELPMSDVLLNVILGMGTSVEILAPESLREELRHAINALQKLYKTEVSAPRKAVQGDLFEGMF